jgi:hypothetical protein
MSKYVHFYFTIQNQEAIDSHGLIIQGRAGGGAQILAKIPRGSRLSGKIA